MSDKGNRGTCEFFWENKVMKKIRCVAGGLWRTGLVLAGGGTVLASSCSTSEVRAVLSGVEAATNRLDLARNDNISFGDWLVRELED